MGTYSDEYCIDMMQYEVLGKCEDIEEQIKNQNLPILRYLSPDDKELLIEYSSKLFNTLPQQQSLYDTLLNFADFVNSYRCENMLLRMVEEEKKHLPNYNKSYEIRKEAFKKHINTILEYTGNSVSPFEEQRTDVDSLIIELRKALQNTDEYLLKMPKKSKYANNKEVKLYLKSLKLPGKTDVINKFIKAL